MSEKKSVERRRKPRVNKRYTVRFGLGDLPYTGYAQDLSESGLHLRSSVTFPPRTVLHLQIDYPGRTLLLRGLVRWSKGAPSTSKRNFGGGMGVEFVAADAGKFHIEVAEQGSEKVAADAGDVAIVTLEPRSKKVEAQPVPSAPPPEASERDLGEGTTRHRQVSTRGGRTFEIVQTEYRGATYVRIYPLPRTDGSEEALFRLAFWKREEAEAAIRAFLKER